VLIRSAEWLSMSARDVLTRRARPANESLRYGSGPDQVASVWLPAEPSGAPVVLFLHGGFWRAKWDLAHAAPLAEGLAAAGFVACLPEYRRVGAGGGWPGTFDDVAAAVDVLPGVLAELQRTTDPPKVVLSGHSAGGHLALWAAARHRLPADAPWRTAGPAPVKAVVGLAAVSDLTACYLRGLGDGAAGALAGGSPAEHPDRYALVDPGRLLPLGVPLWLVHGTEDEDVPVAMSRDFAVSARTAGDEAELLEMPENEHFALIDPLSAAWPRVRAAFTAAARR
jgi:acetyl esterase/lipase